MLKITTPIVGVKNKTFTHIVNTTRLRVARYYTNNNLHKSIHEVVLVQLATSASLVAADFCPKRLKNRLTNIDFNHNYIITCRRTTVVVWTWRVDSTPNTRRSARTLCTRTCRPRTRQDTRNADCPPCPSCTRRRSDTGQRTAACRTGRRNWFPSTGTSAVPRPTASTSRTCSNRRTRPSGSIRPQIPGRTYTSRWRATRPCSCKCS